MVVPGNEASVSCAGGPPPWLCVWPPLALFPFAFPLALPPSKAPLPPRPSLLACLVRALMRELLPAFWAPKTHRWPYWPIRCSSALARSGMPFPATADTSFTDTSSGRQSGSSDRSCLRHHVCSLLSLATRGSRSTLFTATIRLTFFSRIFRSVKSLVSVCVGRLPSKSVTSTTHRRTWRMPLMLMTRVASLEATSKTGSWSSTSGFFTRP
mmetsp:Transcript_13391/g.28298  ORF Transcript_13391/g.28298 Transcript_13391/m.28298 type:complete len:211 (+) Transcript_13391:661-1293(+)